MSGMHTQEELAAFFDCADKAVRKNCRTFLCPICGKIAYILRDSELHGTAYCVGCHLTMARGKL